MTTPLTFRGFLDYFVAHPDSARLSERDQRVARSAQVVFCIATLGFGLIWVCVLRHKKFSYSSNRVNHNSFKGSIFAKSTQESSSVPKSAKTTLTQIESFSQKKPEVSQKKAEAAGPRLNTKPLRDRPKQNKRPPKQKPIKQMSQMSDMAIGMTPIKSTFLFKPSEKSQIELLNTYRNISFKLKLDVETPIQEYHKSVFKEDFIELIKTKIAMNEEEFSTWLGSHGELQKLDKERRKGIYLIVSSWIKQMKDKLRDPGKIFSFLVSKISYDELKLDPEMLPFAANSILKEYREVFIDFITSNKENLGQLLAYFSINLPPETFAKLVKKDEDKGNFIKFFSLIFKGEDFWKYLSVSPIELYQKIREDFNAKFAEYPEVFLVTRKSKGFLSAAILYLASTNSDQELLNKLKAKIPVKSKWIERINGGAMKYLPPDKQKIF